MTVREDGRIVAKKGTDQRQANDHAALGMNAEEQSGSEMTKARKVDLGSITMKTTTSSPVLPLKRNIFPNITPKISTNDMLVMAKVCVHFVSVESGLIKVTFTWCT